MNPRYRSIRRIALVVASALALGAGATAQVISTQVATCPGGCTHNSAPSHKLDA